MFELYDSFDLQDDFICEDGLDFEENLTQDQARDAAKVMTAIVSLNFPNIFNSFKILVFYVIVLKNISMNS